jgi:hypothetical protein
MRRLLTTLLLGWVLALTCVATAAASDGDPEPGDPPASCFQSNGEGELPTCTYVDGRWERSYPESGGGAGDAIALLVVLALLVGGGFTAYKVSMARRMAREAGMDPDRATAMTLLTDDGLEATYLASSLRPPVGGVPPNEHDHPVGGGRTVRERLAELEKLREQELVTEAEYDTRRAAILESL